MNALNEASNDNLNWAIGNLLRQRAARDDWRLCPILQHLETGAPNVISWNELFSRTREVLADGSSLPFRAATLLQPTSASFDSAIDDFIAEMLAAQYLASLGHGDIHFLREQEPITTDLMSIREGITYVTEAKNLRGPNTLAHIAFRRWHHNRAANPEAFNFTAELLEIEDPFEDLTAEQVSAVRNLVDALPGHRRPSTFQTVLPGNRSVDVRVSDGSAGLIEYGPGPFLVAPFVEEAQRTLIVKLLEPTRKALTQLYSTSVPAEYRRLLFVRWKPPGNTVATGELENIRTVVHHSCQTFIRQFFQSFALALMHTFEDIESTPKATWG
jgi:hypothetical protein